MRRGVIGYAIKTGDLPVATSAPLVDKPVDGECVTWGRRFATRDQRQRSKKASISFATGP